MTGSIFPERIQAKAEDYKEWPTTLRLTEEMGSEITVFLTADVREALIEALQNPEKEEDV
jgi:hypothetical protein